MFSRGFFVLKKRYLIAMVCLLLVVASVVVYFKAIKPAFEPAIQKVIVIDAGHGGIDGGCVGSGGSVESELNLSFTKELESLCKQSGLKVVLTRSTMEGLYSPFASNKKRSEMQKREDIIRSSNADLFVSIHMNSSPLKSIRGAQVFYKAGNAEAKEFASCVTDGLKSSNITIHGQSSAGDYYVLNCTDKASILIECGYLSNREDESLLSQKEYQKTFSEGILKGILNFLSL